MGIRSLLSLTFVGGTFVRALVACAPAASGASALPAAPKSDARPIEPAAPVTSAPSIPTPADDTVPPEVPVPRDGEVYCGATVTHWDEHRCIRPFGADAQSRRAYSHRLTYREGRVIRFASVNGRGALSAEPKECAVWDYSYTGDKLTRAVCSDTLGIDRVVVKIENGGRDWRQFDAWGRPKEFEDGKAVVRVRTLDARGRVTSYEDLGRDGRLTPNEDGVCRVETVRDERGTLVEQRYFDDLRKPMLDRYGVHVVRLVHGALAEELERRMFGLNGEPVNNRDGWHLKKTRHNAFGESIEVATFDVNGAPVVDASTDAAIWRGERDAHGGTSGGSYFDARNQPTINEWGYHQWDRAFDEHGLTALWRFFGTHGESGTHEDGHHAKAFTRDARGLVVGNEYFDENGDPFTFKSGYAAYQMSYDARGNMVREEYRDAEGELVEAYERYAYIVKEWDEFDQLVRVERFDRNGHPVGDWRGIATERWQYRSDGALRSKAYFDKDGKVVVRRPFCVVRVGFLKDATLRSLPPEARRQLEAFDSGASRTPDEARRRAEAARVALAAGRPAPVIFASHSDSGEHASEREEVDLEKLPKPLADAARSLRPGQASAVVKHQAAYFVLRAEVDL